MAKHMYVKTRLETLLDGSFESFYWMGLIAADGTINHKTWRLKLHLASKDQAQVERFGRFIEATANGSVVCAQDRHTVPLIAQRFDLKPRKTYHPPDLSWMQGDDLVAFSIGFIDGDGNVKKQHQRQDAIVRIKTHANWQSALDLLSKRLHCRVGVVPSESGVNSQGYATLNLCNTRLIRFLKLKTIELGLPVLHRKWSMIDETYVGRYEKAEQALRRVEEMYLQGTSQKTIAQELGLSAGRISTIVKERGLKAKRLACI